MNTQLFAPNGALSRLQGEIPENELAVVRSLRRCALAFLESFFATLRARSSISSPRKSLPGFIASVREKSAAEQQRVIRGAPARTPRPNARPDFAPRLTQVIHFGGNPARINEYKQALAPIPDNALDQLVAVRSDKALHFEPAEAPQNAGTIFWA